MGGLVQLEDPVVQFSGSRLAFLSLLHTHLNPVFSEGPPAFQRAPGLSAGCPFGVLRS